MSARAAVTLSNENGPSRSWPYQESRLATSDAERPTCAPRRPRPPNAAHQLGAGRA
jgi:hypothetical protein